MRIKMEENNYSNWRKMGDVLKATYRAPWYPISQAVALTRNCA